MNSVSLMSKTNTSIIIIQQMYKKYLSTLKTLEVSKHKNIDISYNSIFTFDTTLFREDNDKNNKLREGIICSIINKSIPDTYFKYSYIWSDFREKLLKTINKIFEIDNYISLTCKPMAGRKYNYDFLISMKLKNNLTMTHKIELKFNSCKIDKCPQFLSLSSNFNTNYASFFYDKYLDEITALYSLPSITKEKYLKFVHQTDYEKDPWFKMLYDVEQIYIKNKKTIVDTSIDDFISNAITSINTDLLTKKFIETQNGKMYLLYCPIKKQFYTDEIIIDELTLTGTYSLKQNRENLINTIVYDTLIPTTKISMLLRWRNHAGILNPAWQISINRYNK